jgi:hypothetical protein
MGFARYSGLVARPSRDFVPAAESLSCAHKKVTKESAPDRTAPRVARGSLRYSGLEAPHETPSATLRSNSRAESVLEVRCAHGLKTFRSSAVLKGGRKTPTTGRRARVVSRFRPEAVGCCGCSFTPLWRSREAQEPRARAQHASRADSAQLFDRSVAKGVLRGPWVPSIAGDPAAQRRGDGTGATFCLLFGRSKSRSPAGANSRLGLGAKPQHRREAR